jgi:uncharacterized protein YndB with AHSA1/START domain
MRIKIVSLIVLLGVSTAAVKGDRVLRKQVTVDGPVAEVWAAWTTVEGVKAFFPQDAKIELKPGGAYEMYFNMGVPAGQRGSEGCTILSFVTNEMLSFTWNAPPKFDELRQEHTRVIVLFNERPDGKTDVELVQAGWGHGGQWDELYAYFDNAWGHVLSRLAECFARPDRPVLPAPTVPYRTVRGEVILNATPQQVWDAFTTSSGLSTWAAPAANVDLRVGGPFELYFTPEAPPGSRGMEGTKVLTFLDREVLSYQGSAPAKYPNVRRNGPWAVYRFEDLGSGRTKVSATYMGWELRNEEYDAAYDHGKVALDYVLGKLKQRFERGPTDWSKSNDPHLGKGPK